MVPEALKHRLRHAELGGAPVSAAAYESHFAEKPENRIYVAMRTASPQAKGLWTIPEKVRKLQA